MKHVPREWFKTNKYLISAVITSSFIFYQMIDNYLENEFFSQLDLSTRSYIAQLPTPAVHAFMQTITQLGGVIIISTSILLILIYLLQKGRKAHAVFWICTLAITQLAVSVSKLLIHRARPEQITTGYSLPSGHSTMSALFLLLLFYTFKDTFVKKAKYLFAAMCIGLGLLIGFSRIFLGAHWLSDVIAGYSLAIGCFSLCLLIYQSVHPQPL